jgi:hypothetical protein
MKTLTNQEIEKIRKNPDKTNWHYILEHKNYQKIL